LFIIDNNDYTFNEKNKRKDKKKIVYDGA